MKHALQERVWASLAHVPIITMIWVGYIIIKNYHFFSVQNFVEHAFQNSILSFPITPILLTLCSIPISLGIMRFKKKSAFIHNNAQAAYVFNKWLVKGYLALFFLALFGMIVDISIILLSIALLASAFSLLSITQSVLGVITALRGGIYKYWYPWCS